MILIVIVINTYIIIKDNDNDNDNEINAQNKNIKKCLKSRVYVNDNCQQWQIQSKHLQEKNKQ